MKPHSKRRPGRLDRLPDELKDLISDLLRRGWTKTEITEALNSELESRGEDPVSRFAVNRYTTRMLAEGRRMREAHEAAAAWARQIGPIPEGDLGAYMLDLVRTLAIDHMHLAADDQDGDPDLDQVTKMALAIKRLEEAHRETDRRLEAAKRRAADEAGKVARGAGLSADTEAAIRAAIEGA